MNKLALILTLVGPLCAGTVGALTIDGFNDPFYGVISDNNSNQGDARTAAGVLGGTRKIAITSVTGAIPGFRSSTVTMNAGDSRLSVSNSDGVDSTVTVTWDGSTADPYTVVTNGLGGTNLTVGNGTGFLLSIPSIDQNVTITLTVWDGDSNAAVPTNFLGPVSNFVIPFNSFAGIDFTAIGAIQMVLNGPVAWDGSVDVFGTQTTPTPATLALLLFGLPGLARARRRS